MIPAIAVIFLLVTMSGVYGEKNPIRITSDRLDAYDDRSLVLFSGNVEAVQGDTVIHADNLYIYYNREAGGGNVISGVAEGTGNIDKIELQGNVIVKLNERTVTGGTAIFYNTEQKIVMTGNAVMMEGENVIKGDRITVFLLENRGVVDGSGGERVTATIYPGDSE